MKKAIKLLFLNTLLATVAFIAVGLLSEFLFAGFFKNNAEVVKHWECNDFTGTLIGGFRHNCNGRWQVKNGAKSFDVEFSTDEFGRRKVFEKARKSKSDSGQVLFFGGSDVLGQGVESHDTVANQFFNLSDFRHVKNFGNSGFGPQHALEFVRSSSITAEAPPEPERNIFLFFFADSHVERLAGSWYIATTWGENFPYYVLNEKDQLESLGTFASAGRFSPLQQLAKKSLLLDVLISKASSYLSYSDANLRLTAKCFAAMKAEFNAKYKNSAFYVIFDPYTFRSADRLKKLLTEFGVEFLDYSKVWDTKDPANFVPDGHQAPRVHRLIAEQLARDLRK